MNKTLEQIKEEVAIEFGYKNWFELRHNYHYSVSIEHYSDIASKRYATECAKEALRLASESATIIEGECGEFGNYIPTVVDKQSILNESNLPKHR